MEELVDRGMVRYIGVSNFSVSQMQEAQAAMSHNTIVCNQVLYNLKRRGIERDLVPYCEERGITVMAYTPLADGSLAVRPRMRAGKQWEALESVAPGGGEDTGAGGPQLVPDPLAGGGDPQDQQRCPHRGELRRLGMAADSGAGAAARSGLSGVNRS